ncbi:MAG: GntR family transcriptional regulator [Verrucomicrobiales bacterium]|nr:GntR family transcriptional regulator [Verrucomicrobiales bacterium]
MSSSGPSYLRIYKDFQRKIHAREFSVGEMLPTDSEISKIYGVSRPTVAKALQQLGDDKLVLRKPGFGTQVLGPRRSALLAGLLIPQFSETEIFGPICASLAETAGKEGMRVVRPTDLNEVDDLKKRTESLAQELIEARVRGVFFAPTEHVKNTTEFNLGILRRFTEAGIQVVLLDRDVHRWPRQSRHELISIDNINAGCVVADHLLDRGCKHLAFVSRENPATTIQLRLMGCREALIQRGMDPKGLDVFDHDSEHPEKAARQLLKAGVDGVVCANDVTASTFLRGLLNLGAKVPEDVKVCGFDNVTYAPLLSVPLTTYQQPCHEIGRIAAEAMVRRMTNPDSPFLRITLQGDLIVRESSGGSE